MILILLLIWLVTGIALMALAVQRRLGSAGLPLAYFLGLAMNSCPRSFALPRWRRVELWRRCHKDRVRANRNWDGSFSNWRGDCQIFSRRARHPT